MRPLHPDDSPVLQTMRELLSQEEFASLRSVATGHISWEEYVAGNATVTSERLHDLFADLVRGADFLCITAPQAHKKEYEDFCDRRAQGIAVDEAGNMNRGDLASLWGNTMRPLTLGGDPHHPPTTMTGKPKEQGNFRHRLAEVSPLEWFQALGFPVFHLEV